MEEVCLIDSNIKSLQDVPLTPKLLSLNCHCNQITVISGIQRLTHLRHLDLSSNQIHLMKGLETLVNLRTLNLASNQIETVEGLQGLRSLVKVNLSYNQIDDISGFKALHGQQFNLAHIELYSNNLDNVQHIAMCLGGCANLRKLSLKLGEADNPACQLSGYRSRILKSIPQLGVLDGLDRSGCKAVEDEILSDIPGLDGYLDFLVSNDRSEPNPITIATPRIDSALELLKLRGATTPDVSTSISSSTPATTDHDNTIISAPFSPSDKRNLKQNEESFDEDRISKIEKQIAELLRADKKSASNVSYRETSPLKLTAKLTQSEENDTDSEHEASSSSQHKKVSGCGQKKVSTKKKLTPRLQKSSISSASRSTPSGHAAVRTTSFQRSARGQAFKNMDIASRDEMRSTYLQLMKELETERERRWKAEEAAKKLAEHIKSLQAKATEEHELQDVTLQATSRLKQALTNERDVKTKLQAEVQILKEELETSRRKIVEIQKSEDDAHKALRVSETTLSKSEREHAQQEAYSAKLMAKRVQDAHLKSAALQREVDILRNQVKTAGAEVQQLQELLAHKEKEHRKDLEDRHRLDSPQMQEVIQRELSRTEKLHAEELKMQQQRIENLTQRYEELEDEFRMALKIESDRFLELQEAYQHMSEEGATNRRALTLAQSKDEKTNNLVKELTSIVKEQKGRIQELSKGKQEQIKDYKERLDVQEAHLEEARKKMVTLEFLKQENVKLKSEVTAQESVIQGLKSERKLWGEELAQQGASLAQDRGRLEAKIEALALEGSTLRKQLDRETDTVKIKTKLIEDQTETIRKLKEGVVERDNQIRQTQEQALALQRDLEGQLTSETTTNQDLQDQLDRARDRKSELKNQVTDLEEELDKLKHEYSSLNKKWKEKSSLIGQLEHQVTSITSQWKEKEKKMIEERDRAIEAAGLAVDKLKAIDDSFRKQLESKEVSHQQALDFLRAEMQVEVDMANKRVQEVEEEMRQLLKEMAESKRGMESRFKSLSQAFSDLQHDLL